MNKKGSGGVLADPKRNKELVRQMHMEKSPVILKQFFDFIEKNFDGKEGTLQYDKDGNISDTMSASERDKMKLAHKMSMKIIDKVMPSTLSIETTNTENTAVNVEIQQALSYIAKKAREEAEREDEYNNNLTEVQALDIKTLSRSEER
jgi:hypothetical protein